jgi:predicted DNA binding protein
MWVAKFQLKDDQDIYSPFCKKFKLEFFANPYTNYVLDDEIHLIVGGTLSGTDKGKKQFIHQIKKDKRVFSIDQYKDFTLIHSKHSLSREAEAEIRIFYNPQYIRTKPVHIASDGWEYWEVACVNRDELNKLVIAAIKYYHGKLISLKKETIRQISSMELSPELSNKQAEALILAFKEGYYNYPRKLTLPNLAQLAKISYSTFQEHLSKGEAKLVSFFLKYR